MKKILFLIVLMGLSSIANAAQLSCSLLEDGVVVAQESASTEGDEVAEINPIERDIFTFGAAYEPIESGLEALMLWASWYEEKSHQHREKGGSLEEVTADGKVLRLECNGK